MRAASSELARAEWQLEKTSHVYATAPVGRRSRSFERAVLVSHQGTPEEVLDALLAIEVKLGRVRREKLGAADD